MTFVHTYLRSHVNFSSSTPSPTCVMLQATSHILCSKFSAIIFHSCVLFIYLFFSWLCAILRIPFLYCRNHQKAVQKQNTKSTKPRSLIKLIPQLFPWISIFNPSPSRFMYKVNTFWGLFTFRKSRCLLVMEIHTCNTSLSPTLFKACVIVFASLWISTECKIWNERGKEHILFNIGFTLHW